MGRAGRDKSPSDCSVFLDKHKNDKELLSKDPDLEVIKESFAKDNTLDESSIPDTAPYDEGETIIEAKDLWFRYEKNFPDVIKGLDMKVSKGEIFAILGGNGTGKSTALSLLSGINKPYRGNIYINGEKSSKIKNLYDGMLGYLPQNVQSVFVKKSVYLELDEMSADQSKINEISSLCKIEHLLQRHPYDLSGGEQQRVALAKVLLQNPKILLLDEPTKGMDAPFKEEFAEILKALKENKVTIIMVSHDIEFCAEYADRCALMFDGSITSVDTPRAFFKGKNFYTTSANRMARTKLPDAVLAEDIILACGGKAEKRERQTRHIELHKVSNERNPQKEKAKKLTPARIVTGSVFALLLVLMYLPFKTDINILNINVKTFAGLSIYEIVMIMVLFVCCFCFFPQ